MAGKTVEEATEQALDQLGVAVGDAEVIVVDEPKTGLFGRVRVEARVRARVRPVGARPRRERSRRSSSGGGRGQGGQGSRQGGQRSRSSGGGRASRRRAAVADGDPSGSASRAAPRAGAAARNGAGSDGGRGRGAARAARPGAGAIAARRQAPAWRRWKARRNGSGEPAAEKAPQRSNEAKETVDMAEGMTLEEQGEVGRAFVADLLSEFGMEGTVETRLLDEDTVEIAALGEDLGHPGRPPGLDPGALSGPDPGRGPAPVPLAHGPHPGRRGRLPGAPLGGPQALQRRRSPRRSWPRARRRRSSR